MNGQDKKDLNVILEQMKQADKDREQMHTDIKFIKENGPKKFKYNYELEIINKKTPLVWKKKLF